MIRAKVEEEYDMLNRKTQWVTLLLTSCLAGIAAIVLLYCAANLGGPVAQADAVSLSEPPDRREAIPVIQASGQYTVYLPLVLRCFNTNWSSPFGTETHDFSSTLLTQGRNAGLRWLRVGLKWKDVETSKGVYNWSTSDTKIDNAVNAGFTPIVYIWKTPGWAVAESDPYYCHPPDNLDDFEDFLTALVNRYKDRVQYWEIYNEEDGHDWGSIGCMGDDVPGYVALLKRGYETIKANDPSAQVLIGGLAMLGEDATNQDFLKDVLDNGGGPYFDIVSFHFYNGQETADYACFGTLCGIRGKAAIIRNWLAAYPQYAAKPLMLTEIAYRCGADGICDSSELERQADHVAIYNVRGMAAGLDSIIWYTLEGPGFYGSSLFNTDGTPKPAYNAYQTLSAELDRAEYEHQMTTAETGYADVEGHQFTFGCSGTKWVLWCTGSEPRMVSFSTSLSPSATFRVVDMYGQNEQILADGDDGTVDNKVTISIGQSPVYVSTRP